MEGNFQNFKSKNLSPEYPELKKFIGKKIINLGFYRFIFDLNPNKESEKEYFKEFCYKEQLSYPFGNSCIFFEGGLNVGIWSPRPMLYDLFVEFNFNPVNYIQAVMNIWNSQEEDENKFINDFNFILLSAVEDNEMCNQTVLSILNKKVLGIDLVKYKPRFGPSLTSYKRYGAIIFHLENEIDWIIGHSIIEDNSDLEIHLASVLRKEIVEEIVSI